MVVVTGKEKLLRIWHLEDKCNRKALVARNSKDLNTNPFHLTSLTKIH